MARRRQPQSPWGRGAVRGLIDSRLAPFQLRIERVTENGIAFTNIWADERTHRMFAWAEVDVAPFRRHPEGLTFLSEPIVRAALQRAEQADAECFSLAWNFLHPQPPEGGRRLRLVA